MGVMSMCVSDCLLLFICSLAPPTGPGSLTLIWSWWTPGSRCSLGRGRCFARWTRWAVRRRKPSCFLRQKVCVWSISSPFQTTGRLKIGTYTGPLQHGIVYSGGQTGCCHSCGCWQHSKLTVCKYRLCHHQVPRTLCVTCWGPKGRT